MKNRKDMKISGWSFEYKSPPENKFPDGCDKFVSLHNHTEYSFLDGMQRVERGVLSLDMDSLYEEQITLVRRAKQLKQPGVGVSDHGTMGSFFRFHTECVNNDINPVIGIEFYFVNDLKEMIAAKDRHYFHVTVFAKNYEGLLNIFRMNKIGWTDGFYYKPKIDWQVLKKFNKNIIGTSGCTGDSPYFGIIYSDASPRNKRIMLGDLTKKFMDIWGDDFYFEIMPNKDYQPSIDLNKTLLELSEKFNVKLVATSDTHYTLKEHADSHEVLLCVQTHKSITDPNRLRFGNGELYLKSRKEIYHDFRKYHDYIPKDKLKEALDNTIEINKQVHIVIPKKYASDVLPKPLIPVEYGNNINLYVKGILKKGWNRRNIKLQAKLYAEKCNISFDKAYDDYKKRLNSELKVIKKMGFIEYFLIIYELLDFCRKNNIFFGPGRGSSAASLVCYLLGITSIDPILYDLMFERFISIYKVTYPDIDLDFDWHKRHLIFDWMEVRFGINCFAHIGSYSVLKGKAVLRDVCRVFDIPLNEVNQITKYVIERSGGDERKSMTISDSFKEFDTMKEFDKKYPFIKKHAIALEGTIRNGSCHPCAVAVSDKQLSDIVPIETRGSGKEKMVISAVTGKENEKLGLLKIDILGLKTLSVIYETIKLVDEKNFDIYRINLEDKKVINEFSKLNFTGVFQFDSIGMRNTFRNYEFKEFDDIIACNALYRPGTMRSGITTDYINRKMGKKIYNKIHPTYDRITEKTAGCVIYQEQITQIFGEMAGYDLSDSDQIRLAIAKSHGKDIIGKHRESFMEGCLNVGLDKKKSKRLFDQIVMFGCISGDTILTRVSANQYQSREVKVKDWYNHFHNCKKYKQFKLFSLVENDNIISDNEVLDIIKTGKKKVYRITTRTGKNSKTTIEHGFKTKLGWRQLREISIGDKIQVTDFERFKPDYHTNYKGSGCHSKGKTYEGQGLKSGENNPNYIDGRNNNNRIGKKILINKYGKICMKCGSDKYVEMHHINFDHNDTNFINLILLCRTCHRKAHAHQNKRFAKGYKTYWDKVKSIKYAGIEETYDIIMNDPNNSFVADNGLIVHNSYGFNKCLTTDIKVLRSSANQFEKRTITLGELYKRWYSKTAAGNKYRNKTRGLKIARFDIETQRIKMGKIKAIYLNGVKKVYKITTNCGYNIKATINERFLTNKGYKRLWQLTIDDELMVSDLVYEQDSYKKNNQIFRNRPCYVNGRTEFFTIAKEKVLKRSQNKCENCSLNNSEYKHVLEFAHIKSFKECNNNFELYHNESNLKLLCNSCHKLFDYGKGERKIRYSKGYPVYYDKIVSINYVGEEMTYDVEMDDNDHNFVANNIVVHNSHASAYSVISYWCMYLKYYYSLEFMTSLLAEEHDDDNIKRYMKECQRLGISIIKPDINKSKMYFSSDKSKREIIVGFLFIKGIGEKSANEIVINQPFDNFDDFIKKINRRIISIRVIKALILSGSFVQWCKNTKKMYENIEEVLIKKKDSAKMFEQFDQEKDWDEETALMMQRKVLKLLTKNHPVFYYHDIIKSFFPNIKLTKLEDIDFSKRQYQLFTIGEIIDLKFNQIGDFDKVKPTISEIEKRKLKLAPQGSRYANFDLEDETGFRRFSAVPIIFNKNRAIFEKGKGTLILIKFRIVKNIGMAYVERMIDLTELKEKKKITNSDGKFLISKSCTQYMEKYKTKLSRNEIVCTFVDLKFYRTRNNDIMSFALLYSDYTDKCYDVLMFSNVIRDKLGHLRDWYVKDKILIVQLSKLQNKNDSPVKYQVVNIKRAVL